MQASSKQNGCEKPSLLHAAPLLRSGKAWTSCPRGPEQLWAVTGQAVPRASEGSWAGNTGVGFGGRDGVGTRKGAEVLLCGYGLRLEFCFGQML